MTSLPSRFTLTLAGLLTGAANLAPAAVELPRIFSDHMVLQRDQPIEIWGRAEAGERVSVRLAGREAETTADEQGDWSLALDALPAGGPHTLSVTSPSGSASFEDVLLGDVWLASGQSNMEWVLQNTDHAEEAIAAAEHPRIRLFTVEKKTSVVPQADLAGGEWLECRPETAAQFSAVAYYFGRALQQEIDVPIGLINSSWGGTDIETWTSWDVMTQFAPWQDIDIAELARQAEEDKEKRARYQEALKQDPGLDEEWFRPETELSEWRPIEVPAKWESTEIGEADGIAWFRKDFELPRHLAGRPATLHLGPVDDQDFTYLNGSFLGNEFVWDLPRQYAVEADLLKADTNSLVVKVVDPRAGGGIHGQPEDIYLQIGDTRIPLAGGWIYRSAVLTSDFDTLNYGPNSIPAQLYNAMVHPIIDFSIKGVIWYQGENNAEQAYAYRELFPAMIRDWRKKWDATLPFYWVQLANFMPAPEEPGESSWAELREAQHMTLELPRTGEAVTIDIGDAKDIHPRNKRDVGERLARVALHDTYGRDVVYSGPVFRRMRVYGDKMILEFNHVDGGLVAQGSKYGYLKGFAIAGEDREFVWAQARIEDDKVIVSADGVSKPAAVRYAWASNPEDANLYNRAGLPASPFRTDDWPGITGDESAN